MEVGTTFPPRKNHSNRFCCVYGCTSLARRNPEIKFVTFPKMNDAERRQKWIHVLKMGKKVTDSMSVCSLHFKPDDYINSDKSAKKHRLKKTAVPSCNLPKCTQFKYTEILSMVSGSERAEKIEESITSKCHLNFKEQDNKNDTSSQWRLVGFTGGGAQIFYSLPHRHNLPPIVPDDFKSN